MIPHQPTSLSPLLVAPGNRSPHQLQTAPTGQRHWLIHGSSVTLTLAVRVAALVALVTLHRHGQGRGNHFVGISSGNLVKTHKGSSYQTYNGLTWLIDDEGSSYSLWCLMILTTCNGEWNDHEE